MFCLRVLLVQESGSISMTLVMLKCKQKLRSWNPFVPIHLPPNGIARRALCQVPIQYQGYACNATLVLRATCSRSTSTGNSTYNDKVRIHRLISTNRDTVLHDGSIKSTGVSPVLTKALAVVGAAAALLASSIMYTTHTYFEGMEGIRRAVSFYSIAIPKYVLYRYHQSVKSPDPVWEQLDHETSQQGLDIILRLKGFYIKCGQMCASNIGNAFPAIWQETMSILQDQVPPEDFETVILPIIRQELPNYQDTFTYIDPIPIGSASIGQVHRAKMIVPIQVLTQHPNSNATEDTKQSSLVTKDVVIKICYPHVERLLRGDVRTIRTFCEIAQPVHVPALKEVEKQFGTEFDYVQEANNLHQVRSNLIRAKLCAANMDDDSNRRSSATTICTMPNPYRQYCTKRVLVMEEIRGDKLVDVLKRDGQRWMEWATKMKQTNRTEATSSSQVDSTNDESKVPKRITTDEYERYLSIMDTSRRVQNAWNRVFNSTIGFVQRIQQRPYQYASELPLNPSKLVDDLLYIHGHQVLVDGLFNADCHPGMFLRCELYCCSKELLLTRLSNHTFLCFE
jgi:aarF domain-containing kinase